MTDIRIMNQLSYDGSGSDGSGSGTSTSTKNANADSKTTSAAEYTVFTPGISDSYIRDPFSTNNIPSINDFKETADWINQNRSNVKTQMDDLTSNLYSTLNQINFSLHLIIDSNDYLARYTNDEANIADILSNALTIPDTDNKVRFDMYDNIVFNNLFINSMVYFEDFSKMIIEAVSYYLTNNGDVSAVTFTIRDIFDDYCLNLNITNNWDAYQIAYNKIVSNYDGVFNITPIGRESMSEGQDTLANQYELYTGVYNDLKVIFTPGISYTFEQVGDVLKSARNLAQFKNGSTLYSYYMDKIDAILDETMNLFGRILDYSQRLIGYNTQYQSTFKDENTYLKTITDVSSISIDLLSSLVVKYPNRNSKIGLITDSSFTQVLITINNLYRREIETVIELINCASRDYKLIRSLETFITEEDSIDNSVIYSIMSNFDRDLTESGLSNLVRLYFEETGDSVDVFGVNSFTRIMANNNWLTEPLYDALAYYRLFMFPFTKDIALVFDFLETMYIFDKKLTNSDFNDTMNKLFDIKVNNIDYININKSKVNESLTSRYAVLDELNYFDIQPYADIISATDLTNFGETLGLIQEWSALVRPLKHFHEMQFSITGALLYEDLNIPLVIDTLSIKLNIRTLLMKLLFLVAIEDTMTVIEDYYSGNVPDNIVLYTELQKVNTDDFLEDLKYLQTLIKSNGYYNGTSTLFNYDTVVDFDGTNIWDSTQIDEVKKIFSLYKEV